MNRISKLGFQAGAGKPDAAGATSYRFKLVTFDEIQLLTTAAYLVRDIIPREGLVVVWGPPKCGKSFWTFDVAMHIALGWEYRDRRVKQGRVVYVACEGERGLGARAEAFRRHKLAEDNSDAPFHLLTTRLDLVADRQQLIEDIGAQLGDEKPAAVVIDTLNRSIAGSESNDEDMGAYVKAANAIREAFNCAVLIIHHCGIDDKRPRGHTSLTGAADAQIAIRRSADGLITTTVEWLKDGQEGSEINSCLEVIELGTDDDGEPITSCVVTPASEHAEAPLRREKLTGAPRIALDLLRRAIDEVGEMPPASNHIPPSVRAVRQEVWRQYCYAGAVSEGDQPAKQKAFKRAADKLQAASAIGVWGDWVWIIR